MPWFHACRRALFTASVTFRLLRSPSAAISFSARHAVGTEATGPNIPLVAHHPEIADHPRPVGDRARQVRQHPALVMAAQRRRQRRRQPGRQARPVRQLPQQS
jgi:hypothetical protein